MSVSNASQHEEPHMRMFERVFVYYPRGIRTGGPEALHQLVDALRGLGVDAALVPTPDSVGRDRVEAYAHYDAPEVAEPTDDPWSAIVFPETFLEPVLASGPAQRICWWLSIDNSAMWSAGTEWRNRGSLGERRSVRLWLRCVKQFLRRLVWRRRLARAGVDHIAQSEYARQFLQHRWQVDAPIVGDYLVGAATATAESSNGSDSVPVVCYNPARGGRHVTRVQGAIDRSVQWLAIEGMTPAQVRQVLGRGSVYLDLGHQPGKDRLPREAALLGGVTLVANVGAGANDTDFALPSAHRIAFGPRFIDQATQALDRVLSDVTGSYEEQRTFRDSIRSEQGVFVAQVKAYFCGD